MTKNENTLAGRAAIDALTKGKGFKKLKGQGVEVWLSPQTHMKAKSICGEDATDDELIVAAKDMQTSKPEEDTAASAAILSFEIEIP